MDEKWLVLQVEKYFCTVRNATGYHLEREASGLPRPNNVDKNHLGQASSSLVLNKKNVTMWNIFDLSLISFAFVVWKSCRWDVSSSSTSFDCDHQITSSLGILAGCRGLVEKELASGDGVHEFLSWPRERVFSSGFYSSSFIFITMVLFSQWHVPCGPS